MRPFRPRLTIRRVMVAVAIVGVGLTVWIGLERRRAEFARIANLHRQLMGELYAGSLKPDPWFDWPEDRYHYDMSLKYERAARYPWLPVAADPPEPKE